MQRLRLSVLSYVVRYAVAILAIVVVSRVFVFFRNDLGMQIVALLYLLPIVLISVWWGLGPGVTCSLTAFLAYNYFFIPPYHTFMVRRTQDLLALIVFLVVAVVISQLLGRAQVAVQAATNREREATRLYELSASLAGAQGLEAIARVLAQQAIDTFEPRRVTVTYQPTGKEPELTIALPEASASIPGDPLVTMPMMTARGTQGTIRIWRPGLPLSPLEERLLRTYASQGALAIERDLLAEAGNRTRLLEESDRLKSALLNSVSHELRSPLATIKAAVSSLNSETIDWDSEARHDLMGAIEEETDHLNQLVGNLLDMTRIEVGALRPQLRWNSIQEIVGGVTRRMRKQLQNHTIELDFAENLPLVQTDYVQMEQVFTNLISNSVKYAPDHTTICICARVDPDQQMHVQVSNQGPPVKAEHLERIFDKFYRVTAADRVTGTGLGLSICKGIIEAHGGRIWAENQPGCFVFNFTLPLTRSSESSLPLTEEK